MSGSRLDVRCTGSLLILFSFVSFTPSTGRWIMRSTLPEFQLAFSCLGKEAELSFLLYRNEEDEYDLDVTLHNTRSGSPFSKKTLLSFMPPGSRWSHALGWRSVFGYPFVHDERTFIIVGVEKVVPHPTRGAYLTFLGFIYYLDKAKAATTSLHSYSTSLAKNETSDASAGGSQFHEERPKPNLGRSKNLLVTSTCRDPALYPAAEHFILRFASNLYAANRLVYFRTICLFESHFAPSLSTEDTPYVVGINYAFKEQYPFHIRYFPCLIPGVSILRL